MAAHEPSKPGDGEKGSAAASAHQPGFGDLRPYVPADILNISFPFAVRGYDRRAVDAYVKRVNRAIAELKVSASPPAAVRHALEQAGEQVHGLLQSARETAEGITSSARQEADESTARAKAEAAELVVNTSAEADRVRAEADQIMDNAKDGAVDTVTKAQAQAKKIIADAKTESDNIVAGANAESDQRIRDLKAELAVLRDRAEARMREIQADTDALWKQRGELLGDIHGLADGLVQLATEAASRLARPEDREAPPEEEAQKTEPLEVVPHASTDAVPAQDGDGAGSSPPDS